MTELLLAIKILFAASFFAVTLLLVLNGLHRYVTIYRYFRGRSKIRQKPDGFAVWPKVTVQLPIYNERYVAERALAAVSQLDYPRTALEIQVLDDSTDVTRELLAAKVAALQAEGFNVHYLRRPDRTGFKAGALDFGLQQANGELIAIFDADFVPPRDFLKATVAHFSDPKLGLVQTRWGHINRNYSLLTEMLAILLDAHFVAEHIARNRNDLFFNFNGTAGIWRKSCIQDAGGWQHDTLTEDLDLSFRAQLKGWQFLYLPEVVSPAELPPEINAVKLQQFRWAKGSLQTARKLMPAIWRSRYSLRQKIEATFHLTSYLPTLWALYTAVFILPSLFLWGYKTTLPIILFNYCLFAATSLTFFIFFEISQRETEPNFLKRVWNTMLLMSIWMGLSISNSRAILEGLLGIKSDFKRTPKFRIESKSDSWVGKKYQSSRRTPGWGEIVITGYLGITLWYVLRCRDYFLVPIVIAYILGFGYVAMLSVQTVVRSRSGE